MRIYLFLLLVFLSTGVFSSTTEDSAALSAQLRDYYFDAARRGDVPILDTFIEARYSLDTRDSKGYTALILAAYHGQSAAVDRLLAAGADACAQDQRGNTALMGAIFKGEVQTARTLLSASCSPDQRNGAGQTAAMYAGLFKRTELLHALKAKGADLNTEDPLGNSATRLASGEIRTTAPR